MAVTSFVSIILESCALSGIVRRRLPQREYAALQVRATLKASYTGRNAVTASRISTGQLPIQSVSYFLRKARSDGFAPKEAVAADSFSSHCRRQSLAAEWPVVWAIVVDSH
jgi:hypothetical protein